ncbi:MAG: CGNR zinc finger domain-containing protein [Clostridiales bacterium]|nr:CGNR zinc finger domain-containing protein [Clostridiales bacterium]
MEGVFKFENSIGEYKFCNKMLNEDYEEDYCRVLQINYLKKCEKKCVYDNRNNTPILKDILNIDLTSSKHEEKILSFFEKYGFFLNLELLDEGPLADKALESGLFHVDKRIITYHIHKIQLFYKTIMSYRLKNTNNLLINMHELCLLEYTTIGFDSIHDMFSFRSYIENDTDSLLFEIFIGSKDSYDYLYDYHNTPLEDIAEKNMPIFLQELTSNHFKNRQDISISEDNIYFLSRLLINFYLSFFDFSFPMYGFELLENGKMELFSCFTDLISSIYLELVRKNSDDLMLKQCKNPNCRNFFETSDRRKIYCSDTCGHSMARKAYKERQKTKKAQIKKEN